MHSREYYEIDINSICHLAIMPSGKHLKRETLELLWYQRRVLRRSTAQIFSDLFQDDVQKISRRYLRTLCFRCDSGEYDNEFNGPRKARSGGPKHVIDEVARGFLVDIFVARTSIRQKRAREDFARNYYGVEYGAPSASTISRTLRRSDITRKVLQRIHYLRSPVLRAAYMARVAPVHYSRLVDVDETTSSQKEFLQRYGYAPRGQVAVKTQFHINGRSFSSICAYSPIGVLAFKIVEGSINSEIFKSFLENELAAALLPNMVGLFDNAQIHHTAPVRGIMEQIFEGRYLFAAPYSPDLKPVERLFAVVKNLLRDREDEAVADPFGVLSECFEMFLPGGPKSAMAQNHFRLYRDNHNMWLYRMGL